MARCRFRPVAYRMGLVFVAVGFVLVGLGYGFPTWLRTSKHRTRGLWHECKQEWSSCSLLLNKDDVFLWAVRAVLGASLLMFLVTFAMGVRENCCSVTFYICCLAGRKTEVFAFVAELLGIAGVLLFSVDEYETVGDFSRLSWAHALCDFGLAVSLIGSIMMACAQQALPAAKAAAGRIVAKPGYESLASNHRSASLQSRATHSTQASPFQGRTTPHISGPYPSPAAIAAVNAAVSPKQQRAAMASTPNAAQQRKLSSPTPYPALDAQSSPSRRRKSSGQGRQFAGVHNQAKHPPVFSSQHVQEEWRVQQSDSWNENMRVEEPGVRQQRALKSQIEQEQAIKHHTNTWSAANDKGMVQGSHTEHHHYDRDWRATTTSHSEQYITSHPKMPPPPAPPSAVAPANYGSPIREGYQAYPPPDGRQPPAGYQYPPPSYAPHDDGQWAHPPPDQYFYPQHHQQRPDSGSFPDPPPPEQLLCYEEDRPTETPSYLAYPNPIPGEVIQNTPKYVQPVVLYRAPSQSGQSPVTETVAIRSQESYPAPNSRPTTPHSSAGVPVHHQHNHHPLPPQPHQTFPRQHPAHPPASPHAYSTFGR